MSERKNSVFYEEGALPHLKTASLNHLTCSSLQKTMVRPAAPGLPFLLFMK